MGGRIRLSRFAVFFVLLLIGCAGAPSPIKIKGGISSSSDLNPDSNSRPSPVVVRVYQLRSKGNFLSADFFLLYDNEQSALGPELIAWEELKLQPGEQRSYNKALSPETNYVGIVVAFRDLENSQWRAIAKIPDKKFYQVGKPSLTIELKSRSVTASFE